MFGTLGTRMARFACVSVVAALAWTASAPVHAGGEWVRSGAIEGRLVAASEGTGADARLHLGIHFRMDKDWKIYWRTPGESGAPPAIDWSNSKNLEAPKLRYPAPHRFEFAGIQSYGYKGEVVLPVVAGVPRPGQPVDVEAKVDVLVCSTLCVPEHLQLSMTVPAGPAAPSQDAALLSRFEGLVPGDAAKHGIQVSRLELDAAGPASLVIRANSNLRFQNPDVFVEGLPAGMQVGAPALSLEEGATRAVLRLPITQHATPDRNLAKETVTVTVVDGDRSVEARQEIMVGGLGLSTLIVMVLTALLGGLILNLMPCVLPVLSLKLLGIAHAGGDRGKVRAGFLATGAGVVFSFLLLAAVAVGLKAAGMAVGWGVQFQQPLFLVFMVVLLALFAANLWGLFEIPLPRFIADATGSGGSDHGSLLGSFGTGAFATLLATPCSAPFLGTAVGFALAGGPMEIVAIFAALGIGMAAPYFLVAAFPRLATWLPRPGAWMVKVKAGMGLALAATGVWLLWVMGAQIGVGAAVAIGLMMTAIWGLLAWKRHAQRPAPWTIGAAAGLLSLAAFVVAANFSSPASVELARAGHSWRPFDQSTIRSEVAAGRTVFVNVTADWCVTCQVNKKAVLDREPVAKRLFGDATVVPMQADWTNPNATIAGYLASFGKYGIPFSAVYGPNAPQGIVLSEILTERAVLEALSKAGNAAARADPGAPG